MVAIISNYTTRQVEKIWQQRDSYLHVNKPHYPQKGTEPYLQAEFFMIYSLRCTIHTGYVTETR